MPVGALGAVVRRRHHRAMPPDPMSCDPTSAKKIQCAARAWCAAIVIGIAGIGVVRAVDDVELEIERIEGQGWSAEGVTLELGLPSQGVISQVNSQATIARLRWTAAGQVWRNVSVRCPSVELSATKIACANASIALTIPALGTQQLHAALAYDRRSGAIAFDAQAPRLAGGAVRVRGSLESAGWQARVDLDGVGVEQALQVASDLQLSPPDIGGAGRVWGSIDIAGTASLQRASVDTRIEALTANNASGTLASDALDAQLRARLVREGEAWDFDAQVEAPRGQAYADPVFLDFGEHALRFKVAGRRGANGEITVNSFEAEHDRVLSASGSARIDPSQPQPVRDLELKLHTLKFPGAYASYLQPFLIDTAFKTLETSGQIEGVVRVEDGMPRQVALLIRNVDVDDGTGMLAFHALNGQVTWRDGADEDDDVVLRAGSERSSLRWRSGSILNLSLGHAALQFTTIGRNFRLVEPASIPLLDGAIELESLRIRNAGLPTVAFMVDATVRPISVAQLCRAFGWPEFGGSLGGAISKLRLRDGVVTLGTTLQAQVFDGRVAIKDLRMEGILGQWPRFHSSIELRNLDLELVTRAFSFGRITGRLSGEIDGLELFNWSPIAFDARLYTPPGDRSRHRISQRAVQNIGSIGGGGTGIAQALSSGVMRFFEEFRYDRLGLSCRLENEVCHMNGVAPAPHGGYYLVKGSGLPRIDVIGSANRVDWPRLVKQLIAITEAEAPVIE
jgi:hypothetical protein